jgi:hypothetical protein
MQIAALWLFLVLLSTNQQHFSLAINCDESVLVLINNLNTPQGQILAKAVQIAQAAATQTSNMSCFIPIVIASTNAQPNETVNFLLQYTNLSAIIGVEAGCSECCLHAATFASAQTRLAEDPGSAKLYLRKPYFISHGCSADLGQQDSYASVASTFSAIGRALASVILQMNWHKVAFLLSQTTMNSVDCSKLTDAFLDQSKGAIQILSTNRIPVLVKSTSEPSFVSSAYDSLVKIAIQYQQTARIIIVIGNDMEFTLFTLAACQQGMIQGYVFIGWNLPAESSYKPPLSVASGCLLSPAEYRHGSLIINGGYVIGLSEGMNLWQEFENSMFSSVPLLANNPTLQLNDAIKNNDRQKIWSQSDSAMQRNKKKGIPVAEAQQSSVTHLGIPYDAGLLYDAFGLWVAAKFRLSDGLDSLKTVPYPGATGEMALNSNGSRRPFFIVEIVNDGKFVNMLKVFPVDQQDQQLIVKNTLTSIITWQGWCMIM